MHLLPAVMLASAAGCVLPPGLELDPGDAGLNSPPVIHDVRNEAGDPFERPGPRQLVVGQGRLLITAADNDLGDTLYVRYYLDYGIVAPTPAKITCTAPPGATPTLERQINCSMIGVCSSTDVGTEHILEVDVYDRMPIDDGVPLFRSVPAPGEYTTWWWKVTCQESGT